MAINLRHLWRAFQTTQTSSHCPLSIVIIDAYKYLHQMSRHYHKNTEIYFTLLPENELSSETSMTITSIKSNVHSLDLSFIQREQES